ncbi:MAG: DUF2225 domain-containing protein, partial [Planctomycetes bacterium]|nr:DUF2225 domain-containing protein [Planctomycetota bacterium]
MALSLLPPPVPRRVRGGSALAAALLAALGAAGTVSATTTRKVDVTCPVCGAGFQAFEVMSTNNAGGQDRDFFSRARGQQPLTIVVWACPACGYAGFKGAFEKTLSPDQKKALAKAAAALRAEWKDEKDPLPPWRRYELALKAAEVLDESAEARGWLALRAAWCVRLAMSLPTPAETAAWAPEGAAFGTGLEETFKALGDKAREASGTKNPGELENALAGLLEKAFEEAPPAPERRAVRALEIAFVFRIRGEHDGALRWLDRVEAPDSGASAGARAFAAALRRGVALERAYQAQAVRLFEESHDKDTVEEENLAGVR